MVSPSFTSSTVKWLILGASKSKPMALEPFGSKFRNPPPSKPHSVVVGGTPAPQSCRPVSCSADVQPNGRCLNTAPEALGVVSGKKRLAPSNRSKIRTAVLAALLSSTFLVQPAYTDACLSKNALLKSASSEPQTLIYTKLAALKFVKYVLTN